MSGNRNSNSSTPILRDQLLTRGDLEDFRNEILAEIKSLLNTHRGEAFKPWLRSKEVRKLLNISAGTLQNFRINRTISYSMLGKIPYYRYDEIITRLEKNIIAKLP